MASGTIKKNVSKWVYQNEIVTGTEYDADYNRYGEALVVIRFVRGNCMEITIPLVDGGNMRQDASLYIDSTHTALAVLQSYGTTHKIKVSDVISSSGMQGISSMELYYR